MKKITVFFLLLAIIFSGSLRFVSAGNEEIKWVQVKIGDGYTMGIKSDGSLWAWGTNAYGQLGDGTKIDRYKPVKIMDGVINFDANSCGAIKKDGSYWIWGYDADKFAKPSQKNDLLPRKMMDNVSQIINANMVIKKDGSLWAWNLYKGKEEYTKKLDGYNCIYTKDVYDYIPKKVTDNVKSVHNDCVLKKDNTLWKIAKLEYNNIKLTKLIDNVADFDYYSDYYMIIKTDTSLWGWGKNTYGRIGNGTENDIAKPIKIMKDVSKVVCDSDRTITIKKDASLWAWGFVREQFDLNNEYIYKTSIPVKALDGVSQYANKYILKQDGSLWPIGAEVCILNDVSSFTSYQDTTIAIKNDGTLWGWGRNSYGQVGNGVVSNKKNPVKIMDDARSIYKSCFLTYVIKKDNSLWAWGEGFDAGNDGEECSLQTPKKIAEDVLSVVRADYLGDNRTYIIKNDGSLWGCGQNSDGRLGDGSVEDKLNFVKIMDDVLGVYTGSKFTVILKRDKSLWACGNNSVGQLGDGTTKSKTKPIKIMENVSSVSVDMLKTSVIKKDGSLWTWGYWYGYPGDGTKTDKIKPTKITDNVWKFNMGFLDSAVIKNDGTLWMWGDNDCYSYGNGTKKTSLKPIKIIDSVTQVIAQNMKTWFVKNDGSLWGCGKIGKNESDITTKASKIMDGVDSVIEGRSDYWEYWDISFLKKDRSLWSMGYYDYYKDARDSKKVFRAKPIKILDNVVQAFSGVALKNDGSIWTWGNNNLFEIGDGTEIIEEPTQIK